HLVLRDQPAAGRDQPVLPHNSRNLRRGGLGLDGRNLRQALPVLPASRAKSHGHQQDTGPDQQTQHQNCPPWRRLARSPKAKVVAMALTREAKSSPSATCPLIST